MAGTNHSPSESDPLLPPAEFTNQSPENHVVEEDTDTRTTAQRIKIAIPCVLTMFLMVVSDTMLTIPVMQIRERIICRQMYRDISYKGATDDPRCKGNDVAAELSLLSGWELTFMLIPSILTGVPWGIAADKYGRRHVLQFANIGVLGTALWQVLICKYPPKSAEKSLELTLDSKILTPMSFHCGLFGSKPYSSSRVAVFRHTPPCCSRLPPMFPPEPRGMCPHSRDRIKPTTSVSNILTWNRTTALLVLATAMRLVSVAAGPLCYLAMQGGDWFAVYLGVALWCLIFPVTAMIPETRSNVAIKKVQLEAASTDAMPRSTSCLNLKPKLNAAVAQTKMVINTIFLQNPSLGILLFSTLFTTLGKTSDSLLAQYATKRFDWKWSEVSSSFHDIGRCKVWTINIVGYLGFSD